MLLHRMQVSCENWVAHKILRGEGKWDNPNECILQREVLYKQSTYGQKRDNEDGANPAQAMPLVRDPDAHDSELEK